MYKENNNLPQLGFWDSGFTAGAAGGTMVSCCDAASGSEVGGFSKSLGAIRSFLQAEQSNRAPLGGLEG